jgi:hypothetical protein
LQKIRLNNFSEKLIQVKMDLRLEQIIDEMFSSLMDDFKQPPEKVGEEVMATLGHYFVRIQKILDEKSSK